jgi:TetR/AcrR family tetracycline transcriptional repressor
MRALAERLEVSPNAIYSHVASKTALIDDVLDDVLAEVVVPESGAGEALEGLFQVMAGSYQALLMHRELVPLYLARQGARGPHAQRLGQVCLALLEQAGVSGARATAALRVLIVYTIGFASFTSGREGGPLASDQLFDNFSQGLRWLLAGITAETPDSD